VRLVSVAEKARPAAPAPGI